MAKDFSLEPLVAFSFPKDNEYSVQNIVPEQDWLTFGSKSPEFVIINNGEQLHTIQEEDKSIKENIYAIGHTPLSVREKDTLFHQDSITHKSSTADYDSLKQLLDTAKGKNIEIC